MFRQKSKVNISLHQFEFSAGRNRSFLTEGLLFEGNVSNVSLDHKFGISWRFLSSCQHFPLPRHSVSTYHISHKLLSSQASWLSVQPRRADASPSSSRRLDTKRLRPGCQRQLWKQISSWYMKPRKYKRESQVPTSQENKMANLLLKFPLELFTRFFLLLFFLVFFSVLLPNCAHPSHRG